MQRDVINMQRDAIDTYLVLSRLWIHWIRQILPGIVKLIPLGSGAREIV